MLHLGRYLRRAVALATLLLLLLTSVAHASGDFNPRDYPKQLKGDHFTLFYATAGENAVTPAYAQQVLSLAEQAYDRLVTKGGLRPPRALPVPVVLDSSADADEGGMASYIDLGYDLWVRINPKMDKEFALADVVAHEFFHVLQASYSKGGSQPKWAIEGTAPVAVTYAFADRAADLDKAMRMHLSTYWSAHTDGMKEQTYMPSLFWYWLADRYGGLTFLHRLFTWSEDVEFERAAQLAAIQGGAPADTTFDSLWRAFVLAMLDGKLPKNYKTTDWLRPTAVDWTGQTLDLTRGERVSGTGKLGYRYAYYEPLVLPPYSFTLLEIDHKTAAPASLMLSGDSNSLEAYVIKPGPGVQKLLADRALQPSREHPAPPPSDPATRGTKLPIGQPMRLTGATADRTLVLVMRLGNWGHGSYSLHLDAAGSTKDASWNTLDKLATGPDSAGTPPKLSSAELAALKGGTWLTGTTPLQTETLTQVAFKRLQGTFDERTVWDGTANQNLPVAPMEAEGDVWFPAKAFTKLLGGRVEGDRFYLGDRWLEVRAGESDWLSSEGWYMAAGAAARAVSGDLLVNASFFGALDCDVISSSNGTYTITYPRAE